MKCLECGFHLSHTSSKVKCWLKWQLCGRCAVKLHPSEYSASVINGINNRKIILKEKRHIRHCKRCGKKQRCGRTTDPHGKQVYPACWIKRGFCGSCDRISKLSRTQYVIPPKPILVRDNHRF